ncbi:41507_t:CDS:2, partial [Gigaspora margarita]
MATQESDIEDRRREDSEMPIINKKRKYKDQEDHIDEVQDPSTTISINKQLEKKGSETNMIPIMQIEVNKRSKKDRPEHLNEEDTK